MTITGIIFSLLLGLALLLLGRALFWVYVGLLGFLVGFEVTLQTLATEVVWLPVLVGLIVGLGSALLAVMLQYVAVGVAGFVGGAYLALALFGMSLEPQPGFLPLLVAVLGGAVGCVLFLLIFDPALIILSSATGALLLTQPFPLESQVHVIALLVLTAIGIVFQYLVLSAPEVPGRKVRKRA